MDWNMAREFAVAQLASDRVAFNILRGPVEQDLGAGADQVTIRSGPSVSQIRLTFDRTGVGNGNPLNPDGDLAVALRAEDAGGAPFGPVSRFDDEGITFRTASPGVKLDLRDRLTGGESGLFDIARFGTAGDNVYDYSGFGGLDLYVHGGLGNDRLTGGTANDHLVGGVGDDVIDGGDGNDLLVGGLGADRVLGGAGDDVFAYVAAADGADNVDLGAGYDTVRVVAAPGEYRLTLTTLEIGNGDPLDGGDGPGEDGGLALRFQAEDAAGNLVGPVSRFDDEGISFVGAPGVTFDVRDLPSGIIRGQGFAVARLGADGDERYDERASTVRTFINAGEGDDVLLGGSGDDLLVGLYGDDRVVGGAGDDIVVGEEGNDRLNGGLGDDLLFPLAGRDTLVFTGDAGNDRVLSYQAGIDRIDLSSYGIALDDVEAVASGADTLVQVDKNGDGAFDFTITLVGSGPPLDADYVFV